MVMRAMEERAMVKRAKGKSAAQVSLERMIA